MPSRAPPTAPPGRRTSPYSWFPDEERRLREICTQGRTAGRWRSRDGQTLIRAPPELFPPLPSPLVGCHRAAVDPRPVAVLLPEDPTGLSLPARLASTPLAKRAARSPSAHVQLRPILLQKPRALCRPVPQQMQVWHHLSVPQLSKRGVHQLGHRPFLDVPLQGALGQLAAPLSSQWQEGGLLSFDGPS